MLICGKCVIDPLPVQKPLDPFPVKPDRHEQEYEPARLMQLAWSSQLWEPSIHSSISGCEFEKTIFIYAEFLPVQQKID